MRHQLDATELAVLMSMSTIAGGVIVVITLSDGTPLSPEVVTGIVLIVLGVVGVTVATVLRLRRKT